MAAAEPIQSAEHLEALLVQVTEPDTSRVELATSSLKRFLKKADCVVPLVQQATASSNPVARQMAAVLLRTKIKVFWRRLNKQAQVEVKTALLQRLALEPHRPVLMGVAGLVAAVAHVEVPKGRWNELLTFLLDMSKSEKPHHRETAMMLFRSLADSIPEYLEPHFGTLQAIFHGGLNDRGSETVRLQALRSIGVLVEHVRRDEHVMAFRQVVPAITEFVKQYLQAAAAAGAAHDPDVDEAVTVAFETFDTLANAEQPVLNQHMAELVDFMLGVALSAVLPMHMREHAAEFVATVVENKPSTVVNRGLAPAIVKAAITLFMEPWTEDPDSRGDPTPLRAGVHMMDAVFLHLPRAQLYEQTLQVVLSAELAGSDDALRRKAAATTLATMAEGCSERIGEELGRLMPVVLALATDREPVVRKAGHVALTQFVDMVQPEIIEHHATIVPLLLSVLDARGEPAALVEQSLSTLECVCEAMEPDALAPYLQSVLPRVLTIVRAPQTPPGARMYAAKALKAACGSAGEALNPYLRPVMEFVLGVMRETADEALQLRCVATECAGAAAMSVGARAFGPFFEPALECAFQGFTLDYIELRASSHVFFSTLAGALGEDFAQLLPRVLPLLIGSLQASDGMVARRRDDPLAGGGASPFGGADEDEDSEPEVDSDGEEVQGTVGERAHISIRTAALDEKLAAMQTLEAFVERVPQGMLPYVIQCVTYVSDLSEYPNHLVRQQVLAVYRQILAMLVEAFPPARQWERGEALPLRDEYSELVGPIMSEYADRMADDMDKDTVANACRGVTDALDKLGMAAALVDPKAWARVCGALSLLWQEKARCQVGIDEEELEDDGQREHDDELMDPVSDLTIQMAAAGGAQLADVYAELRPHLAKFAAASRPPLDVAMAVGTLAEMVDASGAQAAQDLVVAAMNAAVPALGTGDVQVCRNAAFCVGTCFRHAGQACASAAVPVLNALAALIAAEVPEERRGDEEWVQHLRGAQDNATSAVAKMVKALSGSLPVDKCVGLVASGLPLTADFSETEYVYPFLVNIYDEAPGLLAPHVPKLVAAIVHGLCEAEVPDRAKAALVALGGRLAKDHGAGFRQVLSQASAEQQAVVQRALGQQ